MTKGLIVGTGPSLRDQLDLIPRFDGLVFICNNSFQDIPTADVWLACDPKWHKHNGQLWNRGSLECWHWDADICEKYNYRYVEGIWIVDGKEYPRSEYDTPPGPAGGLYMGPENKISLNHCSGAQLLNLAANQYGCDTILLVGHDFRYVPEQPRHFFKGLSDVDGEYPPALRKHSLFDKSKTTGGDDLLAVYKRISETQGLPRIVNATPDSALPWFEMGNFEDYLN
jgi:hypothetical protein